ncbi:MULTISPECIES: FAD-dependent oxidoreductase [unclassified Frondihabitans]|uniref:FAD-dependent oxidoreductase n=1 Tax=unclassified Frondihabitans TaxID=2626248 RepID=UPI000F4FDAC1|nr:MULTISPECIES: FAD-dependent oxidoreductase [unclassified Frondihabitans]RPE77850.1 NADPH-dependent 2,4-dienoyl-CoA reductase/sulfur reductase-like enzyme [Frondihabitans sp. PhB153]RPF08129.1 NADPH-dependent 2,4-dienoyl-CoA reductase/sulfur reductase-like enzyme [Frondihabitans sp. PhB161]
MRISVDMTKCQSYAQCAFLAPDVFRFEGDEALVYDPNPSESVRARVIQSAAACPVQAIRIDHERRQPESTPTPTDLAASDRVVVVGASLAGLTAVESLRSGGFSGSITVIGDEPHEPYDRPPLSKQVLLGIAPSGTQLPRTADLRADWILGVAATGLDPRAQIVHLADGGAVSYDRLLIATGTRARPWPNRDEAALNGIHTIRTSDDAEHLRQQLAAGPRRVLVIGAGFTGSEIASVCRSLDIPVTVVDRGPAPLAGALGDTVAGVLGEIQREHGIDLRSNATVTKLHADAEGAVTAATLSDGTEIDADVVVVAIGALRNTDWLAGSGISTGPLGVDCDAACRVLDVNGDTAPGVFAAGDVAAFLHPSGDGRRTSREHWGNAVAQANAAARNMLSGGDAAYDAVPVFWSTQFGHVVKSVGEPADADSVVIAQGSLAERVFVAVYGVGDRIVGAAGMDQVKWIEHYRRQVAAGASFPPQGRTVDGSTAEPRVVHPLHGGTPNAIAPTAHERTRA